MPKPTVWPVPNKRPFAINVGAVSTQVVPALSDRLTLVGVNTGTEVCYVSEGVAAVFGLGDAVYPGGSMHMDELNLYIGPIYAICATGAAILSCTEGSR